MSPEEPPLPRASLAILDLLILGEQEIAEGLGYDLNEVLAEMDEILAHSSQPR